MFALAIEPASLAADSGREPAFLDELSQIMSVPRQPDLWEESGARAWDKKQNTLHLEDEVSPQQLAAFLRSVVEEIDMSSAKKT